MSGFMWDKTATNQNSPSTNPTGTNPTTSPGFGLFGQPAQNSTTTTNPFGGASQSGSTGLFGASTGTVSSAFGGGTGTSSSGGGGLFGAPSTGAAGSNTSGTTSTTTAPSLFGTSTTNPSGTAPTTGFGFGSSTAPATTGFGQVATAAPGNTTPSGTTLGGGGIFGAKPAGTTLGGGGFFGAGASTPTKPVDSGATAGGLKLGGGGFFGSSIANPSVTPGTNTPASLFGNPATPTSAPAATTAASPFSWNKPTETPAQSNTANGAPGTPGATLGAATSSTGFGLFGAPQVTGSPTPTGGGSGGFSFGVPPKPADATTSADKPATPSGGLFGTNPASGISLGSGGLFGSKPTGTTTDSLFGGASTTQPATGTAASGTSGNLFGQATTKPGGLFGSTLATSTTTSATPMPNLFGTTNTPATSGTPATGSFLGAAQPASNAGGGLFGQPPKPGGLFGTSMADTTTTGSQQTDASKTGLNALSQAAAASKPPAPTGGLAGFTWVKPATPPTTSNSAPSAPSNTQPAAAPASTQPGDKSTTLTSTSTTTGDSASASSSLLGFGTNKPATASATSPSIGLPGTTTAPKPGETSSTTTAASAPAGALTSASIAPSAATASAPLASTAPSVLKGKSLEEIINKWATELDTHARDFSSMANEIVHWDRELGENGHQISHLQAKLVEAEATQTAIDSNLDHVEQQQKELAAALDAYEKQAREILETGSTGSMRVFDMGPADAERDRSYALAADLNVQLDNLSKSLTQMIESVNSLTAPTQPSTTSINGSSNADADDQGSEDPLTQIAAILNAHLKSLQWIDATVQEVEAKVSEAEVKVRETAGGGRSGTHNAGRGVGGSAGLRESSTGSSGGMPLSAFGNLSLRGSEPPRPRGFGLGSSTYRG